MNFLNVIFMHGAGVRLAIFDGAKKLLTRAEEAYEEEAAACRQGRLVKLR